MGGRMSARFSPADESAAALCGRAHASLGACNRCRDCGATGAATAVETPSDFVATAVETIETHNPPAPRNFPRLRLAQFPCSHLCDCGCFPALRLCRSLHLFLIHIPPRPLGQSLLLCLDHQRQDQLFAFG